ncbi:hypothetical protein NW754_011941 [Fusarium falciforme]|nr:hypothetical protein NW754_011941 [Fusarium falciforme]
MLRVFRPIYYGASHRSARASWSVSEGGVPSRADIRLGDVVVGTRVMQYDLGKIVDGNIQRTAVAKTPSYSLQTAVSNLRSKHELEPSRVPTILQDMAAKYPEYGHPASPDRLFLATYKHDTRFPSCSTCDQSSILPKSTRMPNHPKIHHGAIASGNQVMKDSLARDDIARKLDIICFEMETAGLMDVLSCLPIRGICDYADSHKSKEWQKYAAGTAAAYAKELIEILPANSEILDNADVANPPFQDALPNRRRLLLDSFKFEQIDSRKISIKTAHSKTCHWFLKDPQYLEWLDPQKHAQHHGFLWIRGKPGAGKSTIMKFIYLKTKRKKRHPHEVTASFFFHARGEYLEKSIPGMYRSLLLQLLEGYPDLQEVLDDTDLVPQGQLGCPQLNVLKDLFHNAVSNLGQRTFTCFIDALDECDEQQVMEMVRYFEELAESCASTGVQLRICFSSRHYPYIRIRHGIELTLEHQQGHSDDMTNYIQSNLRITSTAFVEELRPQMIEKAAGVFLWVVLVVDILNKENRRGRLALRKRLAEVPSGLSELFKDILRRDANNMEDLLLCILWILCAKRPLRPEEYYHALWSGLALKDLVDPEMPDVTASDSTECIESYVITSSKGLAEITKAKSSTVQFIHESVRDFLVKDRGLQELWPDLGFDWQSPGHERLKQCCSMYLNSGPMRTCFGNTGPKTQSNDFLEVSQHYPFLEYASQYVLYHSDAAAQAIPQAEFLSQTSTADWASTLNFFEKYKIRQYSSKANNPSIDIRGERYESPLFAALANGHKDAVAALLNLPLSICEGVETVQGFGSKTSFAGYKGRTPLTWAAQEGRIAILRSLLQKGINIDENDLQDYTPLMRASGAGHHAVVAFLIKEGVEVENSYAHKAMSLAFKNGHAATLKLLSKANVHWDPDPEGLQEALRTASARGNEEMVKFLIEEGVNVKIRPPIFAGDSALSLALENGHTATSRILFEANADSNLDPETLRIALRNASETGNEEMVKFLIMKEVEINAQNSSGNTALFLASRGGHLAIVKRLIESGAQIDPDAKRSNPKPALIEATKNGHVEVVRLLLERGANIETRDEDGRTPLSVALVHGPRTLASMLIEQGADVNAQDKGGKSPLHHVTGSEIPWAAQLLLRNDAIVDARDSSGRTPLLIACRDGKKAGQRLLIEQGADVNARDKEGNTPLFWACYFGEPQGEPLLLIEKGADVNAKTEQGKTPLHKVCESYWLGATEELVRVLIDKEADIHARDSEGSTPLHLAVIRRGHSVVKLLVERGARVDDRNRKGVTPESLAKKKGLQADDPVMLALKGL